MLKFKCCRKFLCRSVDPDECRWLPGVFQERNRAGVDKVDEVECLYDGWQVYEVMKCSVDLTYSHFGLVGFAGSFCQLSRPQSSSAPAPTSRITAFCSIDSHWKLTEWAAELKALYYLKTLGNCGTKRRLLPRRKEIVFFSRLCDFRLDKCHARVLLCWALLPTIMAPRWKCKNLVFVR